MSTSKHESANESLRIKKSAGWRVWDVVATVGLSLLTYQSITTLLRTHYWAVGVLAAVSGVLAGMYALRAPVTDELVLGKELLTFGGWMNLTYRWVDIARFAVGPQHATYQTVSFDFLPGRVPSGLWSGFITAVTRSFAGSDRNLPITTTLPADELVGLLNEGLALRKSSHPVGPC